MCHLHGAWIATAALAWAAAGPRLASAVAAGQLPVHACIIFQIKEEEEEEEEEEEKEEKEKEEDKSVHRKEAKTKDVVALDKGRKSKDQRKTEARTVVPAPLAVSLPKLTAVVDCVPSIGTRKRETKVEKKRRKTEEKKKRAKMRDEAQNTKLIKFLPPLQQTVVGSVALLVVVFVELVAAAATAECACLAVDE